MMNTLKDYFDRFKLGLYRTFFQKDPVYTAGTKAIDTTASNVSTTAVRLSPYMFPFRNLTPEQKKIRLQLQQQLIDRRLKQIENQLKQEEKNTINDIFKDYGVTKDQRQAIESKINEQIQFEKEYMSRPHKKVGHVDVKPEHMEIYQAAGIHPQSVKLTKTPPEGYSGQAIPMVTGPSTNPLKKRKVTSPPEIKLEEHSHPLLETALLAHEMGHLASHHAATLNTLRDSLATLTEKTPAEIEKNRNMQKLDTIVERQAEILHKTPALARMMRIKRKFGYYPDRLFLGHYAQLAEIDKLHQLKERLENYKPEPMQKLPKFKLKLNAPAPLSQSPQRQFPQKPIVVPVHQNAATAQQLATE
jgi:hypothetical protein